MNTWNPPRGRGSRTQILAAPVPGVVLTISHGARRFDRHWHDAYSVGFIAHGAQRWRGRRGAVVGTIGQVINTNPGEVHDGEPIGVEQRTWVMLGIAPPAMASLAARPASDLELDPPVIDDPRLRRALERSASRIRRWRTAGGVDVSLTLGVEEALVESVGRLVASHSNRAAGAPVPAVAVRRMRERLADATEAPSLAELAALVGLSRFQALRAFARVHGLPPYAWLLSLRAERARSLVGSGVALAVAAAECGFTDQSHMTRVFTRHYGYTPGEWCRGCSLAPRITSHRIRLSSPTA